MFKNETYKGIEIVFLLLCFLIYMIAFFPGILTPDPVDQLSQAMGLSPVNNWHPPFATFLLYIGWHIFHHVSLMWVLQVIFWFYLNYALAIQCRANLIRILFLLVAILLPTSLTTLAIFWKDSWCLLAIYATFYYMIVYQNSSRIKYLWIASLFFIVAILLRENAIFYLFPLAIYLAYKFSQIFSNKRSSFILYLLLLGISYFAISFALTNSYVKVKMHSWQTPVYWDLAGISVKTNKLILPGFLFDRNKNSLPTLQDIKDHYNYETSDPLFWSNSGYQIPLGRDKALPAENYRSIFLTWIQNIEKYPGAYLAQRSNIFKTALTTNGAILPLTTAANNFNMVFIPTYMTNLINSYVHWSCFSILYKPLFSFILMFIWMLFFIKEYFHGKFILGIKHILLLSLILLFASNFFLLPAIDFRYYVWAIYANLLLIFLEITRYFKYV